MKSRAHVVNVLLVGATAVLEWGVYAEMLAGRAVPLSVVALLVGAFFYGFAGVTRRFPSLLNLPNQDAYNALPEADQRKVINQYVCPFFYWSASVWMGVAVLLVGMTSMDGIGEGPTLAAVLTSLIVTSIADGGLAIYFLFLRAPQKVDALQESVQEGGSG